MFLCRAADVMVNINLIWCSSDRRNETLWRTIPAPARTLHLTPTPAQMEALMQSYYPHNHSKIHHIFTIFSRLPPIQPFIFLSPPPGDIRSLLSSFSPLYHTAMINLWDIFPMGFHKINGYFGASHSRDQIVCMLDYVHCVYVDSHMLKMLK